VLDDVVPFLACPHCGQGLSLGDGMLRCSTGHAFEVARHGYVSLLHGSGARRAAGDTLAMVRAREEFLGAGHLAALSRHIAAAAATAVDGPAETGCVVDAGAGTGHHLASVLGRLPHRAGLALDASRHALRRALRAHPRIGAVLCDVWRPLPVRDGAAALVMNVFAPRNAAEMRRVLRPAGALLTVTPTGRHLHELVTGLGLLTVDERKQDRLSAQLGPHFELAARETHEELLLLDHRGVEAVVGMGPNAWHTDAAGLRRRIAGMPEPLSVTLSVTVSVHRCRR
jgi:23S rRNA (guanine745-N1)-methyltransferase